MTDHSARHAPGVHVAPGAVKHSQFEVEMNKGVVRMMEDMHGPGYTGNPDHDFLLMMIPLQKGAIDTARVVL